jgi:hypothetical protein
MFFAFLNTIGRAVIAVVRVVVVDVATRVDIPHIVRVAEVSRATENVLRSYQPTSRIIPISLYFLKSESCHLWISV